MSSDQATHSPTAPLQFDAADVATAAPAVTCAACKRAVTGEYYQINDGVTCDRCHAELQSQLATRGSRAGRALRATAWGLLGGLAGGAVWWAVLEFADLQVGFIAILVGVLVG